MQIILVRHGNPEIPAPKPIQAKEFSDWIESYNNSGLKKDSLPSPELKKLAEGSSLIVSSNLARSIESAKRLGINEKHIIDKVFREMEMPHVKFSSPKVLPIIWAIIFRGLWYLGFSPNSETRSQAKRRAVKASYSLIELAKENESVIFVGHQMLNNAISKHLLRHGWVGPKSINQRYWWCGVYKLPKT